MQKNSNIKIISKNIILILILFTVVKGVAQESVPEGLEKRIENIYKEQT